MIILASPAAPRAAPIKPSLNIINVVTECQDRVGVFQRKMVFMNCRNSSKPPLSLKNDPEAEEPMIEPDGLGEQDQEASSEAL